MIYYIDNWKIETQNELNFEHLNKIFRLFFLYGKNTKYKVDVFVTQTTFDNLRSNCVAVRSIEGTKPDNTEVDIQYFAVPGLVTIKPRKTVTDKINNLKLEIADNAVYISLEEIK